MNSKLIQVKYLAVVLLGIVFLVLASVDAFSQSDINIGAGDTYIMNTSKEVNGKVINARINVVKTLRSKNYDLSNCTFSVELVESGENYSAHCMEAIVKLFVVDRKEILDGETHTRSINVDLDFAPIADLAAMKYGLVDLGFNNGVATFEAADLSTAGNFKLNVLVSAPRHLLKDKILVNRTLDSADYSIEKLADGKARISIDLKRLTNSLEDSKDPKLKIDLSALKPVDVKGAINMPGLQNALSASLIMND